MKTYVQASFRLFLVFCLIGDPHSLAAFQTAPVLLTLSLTPIFAAEALTGHATQFIWVTCTQIHSGMIRFVKTLRTLNDPLAPNMDRFDAEMSHRKHGSYRSDKIRSNVLVSKETFDAARQARKRNDLDVLKKAVVYLVFAVLIALALYVFFDLVLARVGSWLSDHFGWAWLRWSMAMAPFIAALPKAPDWRSEKTSRYLAGLKSLEFWPKPSNLWSSYWDSLKGSVFLPKPPIEYYWQARAKEYSQYFADQQTIVDAGSGEGKIAKIFDSVFQRKARGFTIHLVDRIDTRDVSVMKMPFHQADMAKMDFFESSSVAAVATMATLEYLNPEELHQFFGETKRILLKGGFIDVLVQCADTAAHISATSALDTYELVYNLGLYQEAQRMLTDASLTSGMKLAMQTLSNVLEDANSSGLNKRHLAEEFNMFVRLIGHIRKGRHGEASDLLRDLVSAHGISVTMRIQQLIGIDRFGQENESHWLSYFQALGLETKIERLVEAGDWVQWVFQLRKPGGGAVVSIPDASVNDVPEPSIVAGVTRVRYRNKENDPPLLVIQIDPTDSSRVRVEGDGPNTWTSLRVLEVVPPNNGHSGHRNIVSQAA